MYSMVVTWETSHPARPSPENEEAPSNIDLMVVTWETFHPARSSPENEEAPLNIPTI
jgi:hypothetical protein